MANAQDKVPALGQIVRSKTGRDKGRAMMVAGFPDQDYVWLADGVMRRLAKPKRKKIKHLELRPEVLDGIARKLREDKKVFDAEIRSALRNLGYLEENGDKAKAVPHE